jgi:hypothetical protein
MSSLKLDAKRIGPYSRAVRRGALGDSVDGRSRAGKMLKRVESELLAQIPGEPSFAQKLLARRAARAVWMLDELDLKLVEGRNWNACDSNTQGGLGNSLRLILRELGVGAGVGAKLSVPEYLAQRDARRAKGV